MKSHIKRVVLSVFLLVCIAGFQGLDAAGECGRSSPEREVLRLAPCATAAQDVDAPVSVMCCTNIQELSKNPSCLCAVILSDFAQNIGFKPDIVVTIPKRCNIADRPIGYKCGDYTFSSSTSWDWE